MVVTYTYTGGELCFGGQLGGYAHLILPTDPFRGWLVEEISEVIENGKANLLEQGHVSDIAEGAFELNEPFQDIVDTPLPVPYI